MFRKLRQLLVELNQDDSGALIPTEYLTLGGIVVLGSVGGLTAMRDASVSEMKEFGNSVRNIRQTYYAPGFQTSGASKAGSAALNNGIDSNFCQNP